jgi:4-hydroxythreonine-4-phosphate dehydrogenase
MKRLAITIGDTGGIGPEVALKALLSKKISGVCSPVLVGDRVVIEEVSRLVGLKGLSLKGSDTLNIKRYALRNIGTVSARDIQIIDAQGLKRKVFTKGRPSAAGGRASEAYIKKAVQLAMAGEVDAVVTAPISKEALRLAGLPWPGHTEMLAELTGTRDYAMMLVGGQLRVILVTIHTALRNVPGLISRKRVLKTIRLARKACDMLGIEGPRIAVAGLNPHAGESGMLGAEEEEEIIPAMERARKEGLMAEGPYPPDVIFHKAYKGDVDIVVCMYHDQGLIPLKMIAFEKGVNVTVGLPIIRTSPDHGTAYDIAWKGIADPSSMIEAIILAAKLKLS